MTCVLLFTAIQAPGLGIGRRIPGLVNGSRYAAGVSRLIAYGANRSFDAPAQAFVLAGAELRYGRAAPVDHAEGGARLVHVEQGDRRAVLGDTVGVVAVVAGLRLLGCASRGSAVAILARPRSPRCSAPNLRTNNDSIPSCVGSRPGGPWGWEAGRGRGSAVSGAKETPLSSRAADAEGNAPRPSAWGTGLLMVLLNALNTLSPDSRLLLLLGTRTISDCLCPGFPFTRPIRIAMDENEP